MTVIVQEWNVKCWVWGLGKGRGLGVLLPPRLFSDMRHETVILWTRTLKQWVLWGCDLAKSPLSRCTLAGQSWEEIVQGDEEWGGMRNWGLTGWHPTSTSTHPLPLIDTVSAGNVPRFSICDYCYCCCCRCMLL